MRSALRNVLRRLRALVHRPRHARGPRPPDDRDLARHLGELARRYREQARRDEGG